MLKKCVLLFLLSFGFHNAKGKIVIDNDAGGDDAVAIFLALLYEKYFDGPAVVGLTTGNGNTHEDNVYINNQKILKVAKRQDVPIYRGSKTSLVTTPPTTSYYGEDGLGNNDDNLGWLVPGKPQGAVEALIELSKTHENNLTVITIGTLTNVALAMKMDSNFLSRLKHLYVGAGHVHSDLHPNPEFNAHMDVEAYRIMAQNANPDKVTVFPFSTTKNTLNFTKGWRQNVLGTIDTEIMRAMNRYEKVSLKRSDWWTALDPSVIAAVVKPDLVEEYRYSKNDIITCGKERGMVTNNFVEKPEANVRIVHAVKTEEYRQFLLDVFSAELKIEVFSL